MKAKITKKKKTTEVTIREEQLGLDYFLRIIINAPSSWLTFVQMKFGKATSISMEVCNSGLSRFLGRLKGIFGSSMMKVFGTNHCNHLTPFTSLRLVVWLSLVADYRWSFKLAAKLAVLIYSCTLKFNAQQCALYIKMMEARSSQLVRSKLCVEIWTHEKLVGSYL